MDDTQATDVNGSGPLPPMAERRTRSRNAAARSAHPHGTVRVGSGRAKHRFSRLAVGGSKVTTTRLTPEQMAEYLANRDAAQLPGPSFLSR